MSVGFKVNTSSVVLGGIKLDAIVDEGFSDDFF